MTNPAEDCVLLVPDTEVVVSPKVRGTAVKDSKPKKPNSLPARELEEFKPRFSGEDSSDSNSSLYSSGHRVSPSKWSWKEWVPWLLGVQNTSNKIQDPDIRDFEKIRKKSVDYKGSDTIPEGLNFTFRVQPCRARNVTRKGKIEDPTSPSPSMDHCNECNFLQQPAVVFVNAEDIIEQTGNMNLHIPGMFLARLSKLLSPKIQMTEMEKELNAEKSKGIQKTVPSPKSETTGAPAKEKDHLTQCIVRVVVLDRKKTNTNESCEEMLQKVTQEQPLLCHHVIVSDTLRRLMKLDATSCVWLQTISAFPVMPTSYQVHPMGSLVCVNFIKWEV